MTSCVREQSSFKFTQTAYNLVPEKRGGGGGGLEEMRVTRNEVELLVKDFELVSI